MSVPLAERVMKMLEEGMSLWKTFIATRQEAYERQQDKAQRRAIESAEKYIFANDKLLNALNLTEKEFKDDLKILARYRKRFFHYH